MSDERFILCQDDLGNYEIWDDDKVFHFLWEVAPILNEQQEMIDQLEKENTALLDLAEALGVKIVEADDD